MSIEDIFDTAAEDIFDTLGVDATFTPSIGDPVEDIKVNLMRDTDFEPSSSLQTWGSNIIIEAILDDLGKEPDKDETFTINLIVYTVQSVLENDGRFVRVMVK